MYQYDVEAFMGACDRKGLSAKTMKSYEQTLRLFGLFLAERGITQTEEIRHPHIEAYIDTVRERGKYTVCAVQEPVSPNYPERRRDYGKKVSPVTINNYLRNMKAFFNWCVREELIRKNPIKPDDTIKVERKPLAFVTDTEFKKLLACLDTSKFSEYRDSVIM
jgi:integrase/recombinase XerD